jgi:23S rRNA (guanosine2251-2'-O)-methyltransferase
VTRKTRRRGGGFGSTEALPAANNATGRSERPRPREASFDKSASRPARRQARSAAVVQIYGFHSVVAALRAPRRKLVRLYATAAAAERLGADIAARGLETRILAPEEIALRAPRGAVHQGLLLEARPLEPIDISQVPAEGLVVALDQVTDPHNFGAILRTCAAFAVDALVTTERHSPQFAGALAKSASGGLEHVAICSVANLARALADLGDLGYWRVGLDSQAPLTLGEAKLARPLALVLGAEDKGLRRLTREHCDVMARLDLPGAIQSLNVSNACAVALAIASGKWSQPA